MNCDIATGEDNKVGLGFVIRNHEGQVLLAGKKIIEAEGSTTLMEGLALVYGFQMCRQYNIRVEEAESDNKSIIDCLKGVERPGAYVDVIVEHIRVMAQQIGCMTFGFTPRQAKIVAHKVAHDREFISIGHNPEHVSSSILQDVMMVPFN